MNRIYKVIWSKVKHQYVVVSELAHSNGKQNSKSERTTVSGSLRALAAALVVSGSLLAMPYTASAAEGDVYYQLQNGDEVINIEENDLSSYFKIAEKQADGTYTINGQIVANEYLYDLGIDFNGDGKTEVGAFVVNDNIYTGDVYNQNHDVVIPEVQHTITNEDGFYASNGKGTYNSLTKDGLWVGGTKDGEGFHVDNDGNVRTTGNMMVDGKFSAGDNTVYVDENGNFQAANGKFTVDNDGTTYAHVGRSELQVTEDQAALRHGNNGVIVNEDGVAVVGEFTADNGIKAGLVGYDEQGNEIYGTQIGQDGSFSTAQGNFKVDAEGNVNAVNSNDSAITMNDDGVALNSAGNGIAISDEGILLNTNGSSITVDKFKGTTFTNTNTGKFTNINGDTVTTGKVTGLSNTTWDGTTNDESRAATEGQLSDVQENVDSIDKRTVHIVHSNLDKGKHMTAVEKTKFYNDGSIESGSFKVDSNGSVTANKINANSIESKGNISSAGIIQAVGNGDVKAGEYSLKEIGKSTEHIDHVTEPNGTDYTSVEGTKFYADGNVDVKNALTVGGQTTINANADIKGTLDVAGSKFKVNDQGDITTTGELSVGNGKFTVNTNGDTEVGGTLTVQGYTTVNANAKIAGNLTAATLQNANETFKADENGNVTATSVETKKLDVNGDLQADSGTIGGVELNDYGITAAHGSFTVDEQGNLHSGTENGAYQLDVNGENGISFGSTSENGAKVTVTDYDVKFSQNGTETHINGNNIDSGNNGILHTGRIYAGNGGFNVDENGNVRGDGSLYINSSDTDKKSTLELNDDQVNIKAGESQLIVARMGAGLISKDTGVIVQDDSVVIGKPSESWVTIKPEATTFESDANDGVTEIKGGQLTTDDLTATSGNIGNVTLENGKVTADKANIGDVWIKNGSITHVDKLAAERADIGGVWIKDDTITSLTNTEWDAENAVRNRAATEGQLLDVDTKVNQNTNKLDAYESAGIVAGTRNNPYTVDGIALGTDSYANGTGATAIGGDAKANQYNSVALGRGAVANAHDSVALGAYSIANDENVVSVGRDDGSIQRRIVNVADGEKDSDAATVGQMNKATDGMVKWDKDTDGSYKEGTIGGVTMKDGTLDVNGRFHVNDNGGFVVEDENGNRVFRVLSQGGLQAASGKFVVASDTGNVITQGSVTAESGTIGNIQLDGNEITGKDKAVSVNGVTLSEYSTTTTTARAESENQDGDILLSGSNGEINVSALDRITEDVADRTQKISYDSEKGITKIGDEYGVEFSNNGAISAAKGNFKVADNGNVTLKGDIDVKDSEDNTKVKVEAATGKITTEDTMYVNGNEEVATENYVNTATENMVEWDAGTKDTIHGVTLNNGTITAANSKFKVYDNGRVEAAGGKFNVWSSGGIGIGDKDADGNRLFSVNGNNGDVITKGDVTAQGTMYVKGDEEVATKSSVDTVNDTLADYENAGIIAGTSNVDNDVVIGSGSSNTAEYGIAIGEQASNTGFGSMAVGAHTMVSGNNSVALGFGSQATENNVVSVGGYAPGTQRRIINVADGIENSDVATVGQMNTKVAEATENMVEWDAGTNNTIHGVTLNGSTITAGNGAFNVYSTGGMTALYGKFAGSITAADEKFKVDGNGGITGQSLDVNKGIIKAADGKFNVYTSGGMTATYGKFDGGITAAGEKFNVDGNGNIITQEITAANGKFHVWGSTGGISAAGGNFTVNGYNGDVVTAGTMYVNGGEEVATKSSIDTVKDSVNEANSVIEDYQNAGMVAGTVDEAATNSIAIGSGATITTRPDGKMNNAVVIGTNATTSDWNTVTIGADANVAGENSVAIGKGASATDGGYNSVALGYGSKANDNWVVSVGNGDNNEYRRIINVKDGVNAHDAATVGQMNSLIFGTSGDTKSLTDGTLLTNKAKSLVEGINKNSEAIKLLDKGNEVNWDATTNNINEMQSKISTFSAMTSNVDWNAVNSVDWNAVSALSQVAPLSADVTGEFDTTREPINDGSSNTGDEINTGEGNTVNGDSHVTGNAQIDGTLNVKGEATFDGNATFNGKVDMNGELNMNNNKITGVADGAIAEGSTDAVNGGQLFDMQNGLNSRMDNIESRMNDVEDRIDKVGAMAAAIANLRTMGYDPEAPTEIAVGVGQYKSETGLALGIFHYPNQDFMLSASISTSGDEVMGGIGATWKLGRKSAEERAKDEEERILAKAEEIKQAAKRAEVKAQADRHAQLLAEREEAGQPIRPVEEA